MVDNALNKHNLTYRSHTVRKLSKCKSPASKESDIPSEDSKFERNPPIIKGCFIATAAMDSELHPYVQSLREFRDNILLQSKYKGTFDNLLDKYYRFSPPIAKFMKKSKLIKILLKFALVYPIVFLIKAILPICNIVLGIEKDAKQSKKSL
jgi:hypothetical protein